MNKKILATAALFLAVSASSAFAENFKGTVSDAMCGGKHVGATKEDMACAQKCVKGGEKAVLIVGDKTYKIENQDAVKNHIGHKVNVMGTLDGDTIHIDKVTM
jgi:hypothetical protein